MKLNGSALLVAGATLGAGGGLAAIMATAASANTDPDYPNSTLTVSIPGQPIQGKVLNIIASGSNAATDPPINYGLWIFLVNPTKYPEPCAASEETEEDDASANSEGIRQLNFETYNEGTGGSFDLKVPFTPAGYGKLVICAYSTYVTDDAAWATTEATISPSKSTGTTTTGGSSGKPSRPRIAVPPALTQHGTRLSCAHGTWSGKPASYAYAWKVDGQKQSDKRSSLTLAAGAKGTAVCTVTAKNSLGSGSASSHSLKLG